MHFWIDKRATSWQYGRRPPFYSGGFGGTGFRRERRSTGTLGVGTHQFTTNSFTPNRRGSMERFSPRHYYWTSPNHHAAQSARTTSTVPPRRPSPYAPIPDPTIQEALDELDAELRVNFPPTSAEPRTCFNSKQIGLCLCFLGFILLCTVAGKFIVEGPGLIDASRRPPSTAHIIHENPNQTHQANSSIFFFIISELIFVAFALGLFFAGVTCLRKRTNAYLLGQFRRHILNSSSHGGTGESTSSRSSGGTLMSMSDDESRIGLEGGGTLTLWPPPPDVHTRTGRMAEGRRVSRYALGGSGIGQPGRNRRCSSYTGCQKPPPYDVAIYLPLPNQQAPRHALPVLSPPSKLNIPPTRERLGKDEDEEKSGSDPLLTSSSSRAETPPPAYELQFSYEI